MSKDTKILEMDSRRKYGYFPYYVYELCSPPNSEEEQHVPLHWHNELEIIFCEEPASGVYQIDHNQYAYTEKEIFIINPQQLHSSKVKVSGWSYHIVFNLSALKSNMDLVMQNTFIERILNQDIQLENKISNDHDAFDTLKDILYAIKNEFHHANAFSGFRIYALLSEFIYQCGIHGLYKELSTHQNYQEAYFVKTRHYIEANYMHKVTVRDLAAYVGLSPTYFSKLFMQHWGEKPIDFLNAYRIGRACTMLQEGMSVTETALEVGMPDVSHFIRIFKKVVGKTPYKWAKSSEG